MLHNLCGPGRDILCSRTCPRRGGWLPVSDLPEREYLLEMGPCSLPWGASSGGAEGAGIRTDPAGLPGGRDPEDSSPSRESPSVLLRLHFEAPSHGDDWCLVRLWHRHRGHQLRGSSAPGSSLSSCSNTTAVGNRKETERVRGDPQGRGSRLPCREGFESSMSLKS